MKKYLKIGLLSIVPICSISIVSCDNNTKTDKINGNLYKIIKSSNNYVTKNSDIIAYKIEDAKSQEFRSLGIKYLWFQFRNGKIANIKFSVQTGWIKTGGELPNNDAKNFFDWTLKNNIKLKIAPKININLIDENLNISYEAQDTKKYILDNISSFSYKAPNPSFKPLNKLTYSDWIDTEYIPKTTEIANLISGKGGDWWKNKNTKPHNVNIKINIQNYPVVNILITDDRSKNIFNHSSKYAEKEVLISYALWITKLYNEICNNVIPTNTFLLDYNFISWNNKKTEFIVGAGSDNITHVAVASSEESFFTEEEKTKTQFVA